MAERRKDHYRSSIFAVCESMHLAHTGAGDTLRDDERSAKIDWLQYRLSKWVPSLKCAEQYDNAVKALIEATLAEQEQSHG